MVGWDPGSSVDGQLKLALDVTNSFLWVLDVETGEPISQVGPTETLFHVPAGEMRDISAFFDNCVHPDDATDVESAFQRVRDGDSERFDVTFRTHPDRGEVRWVRSRAKVEMDNGRRLLTGISTDVTERTRRERELQERNERLEEFAGVLSHDLRNPLHRARSHLELARDGPDGEHLDAVGDALSEMETLIDALLTAVEEDTPLVRGGGPDRETGPVDLASVVETCWESLPTAEADLRVETGLTVRTDRGRLKRLLNNLLRNAIEHGGSDVTVRIDDLETDTGFYVADDGPGIPPAEREAVFESGYSSSDGGNGLGLFIVEQVADAEDWRLEVTDSRSGGAHFEVRDVPTV